LGEIVVGRPAEGFRRESSVKDLLEGDEGGSVGVACSICAGSATLGFFQVWQIGGRSPWVEWMLVGGAVR
jgi:hypothetical protein